MEEREFESNASSKSGGREGMGCVEDVEGEWEEWEE